SDLDPGRQLAEPIRELAGSAGKGDPVPLPDPELGRERRSRVAGHGANLTRRVRGSPIFRAVSEDDGHPIHYAAVKRGTPVYASDGQQVGTVDEVLDNYRERIFDGLVIETGSGELRFVDA